jgi:hypothetical protein
MAGVGLSTHLGELTDDQFVAPGAGGKEAYANVISDNKLCANGSGIRLFDGEQRRQDNEISGNSYAGVDVGTIGPTLKPLDAEKISNNIALMRQRRLNDSAIRAFRASRFPTTCCAGKRPCRRQLPMVR